MNFGLNVKRVRIQKNMSLHDLALKAEVSKTMLYAIEKELKIPTLSIACRISTALDVDLSMLIDFPSKRKVTIIKKTERVVICDKKTNIVRELLSPPNSHGFDLSWVRLPPGGRTEEWLPPRPGFQQYIALTQGFIRIQLSHNQSYDLKEGDTIFFAADARHEIVNLSDDDSLYYWIVYKLS